MPRRRDNLDRAALMRLASALGLHRQEDIARACGVDAGALSKYLKGTRAPSQATLTRLAVGLGATRDQLIAPSEADPVPFQQAMRVVGHVFGDRMRIIVGKLAALSSEDRSQLLGRMEQWIEQMAGPAVVFPYDEETQPPPTGGVPSVAVPKPAAEIFEKPTKRRP